MRTEEPGADHFLPLGTWHTRSQPQTRNIFSVMTDPAAVEAMMKRVRHLEIRARRLVRETFGGEYQSSFKGQGLDFNEFREWSHLNQVLHVVL